ncbi:hypothetical protein GGS20DRAFT_376067 [Poronia punctata]|nr:hypothetical protein GGS20DRAFT_376067 [Poronia punctata]
MSALRTSVFRSAPARLLPSSRITQIQTRLLHQTAVNRIPYKDDMDRESLKPKAHEYTQSGTDDETAAKHDDAAFNPKKTSPEEAKDTAEQGAKQQNKDSPLESSPANHSFSEGGKGTSESTPKLGKSKASGGHSSAKSGKVV